MASSATARPEPRLTQRNLARGLSYLAAADRDLAAVLDAHGPCWTADSYLLMVLLRRDVWPVGDLALARAAREVKGLEETPAPAERELLAEPWRPWRSVAARVLWHHQLETRTNGRGR